jgi:tetratricopeptide (TPR) repeat protein
MTLPLTKASQDASKDAGFAELVEDLTARLQNGEVFDVEAYLGDHAEHAERLRELLPALQMLGKLSISGHGNLSFPPDASEESLPVGTLGDFRILREVGRGGMGVVYEAEQISLGRRVALKVLPFAATMDPRALQRFQNEARAAACLHHANVVPVHYVGCERGVHFYAMQFIDGQTLADLIRELRRPAGQASTPSPAGAAADERTTAHTPADKVADPKADTEPAARQSTLTTQSGARSREFFRRAAGWGVQAAEALDYAHQAAIVHRDVKPGNLMLDVRGNLWVADFGLAHIQHSEASLTMTGDLVGTLRYMSPEQALAKRVPIDHRTDVYSLGATLYELLTLQPAVAGKDRQEVLRQIAFEEPKAPRRVNRAIPAELETIVLKAMEKNPAERYATAMEMADDLRRFLADEPIRAKRPGLLARGRKWARRHQPVVWSAAVIGFILMGSLGWIARDLAQRRLMVEQGINNALAEVERLRRGSRTTTLGDQAALSQAREQIQRAQALAEAGPADARLIAQVRQLASELDQEQRDQELLAALNAAWLAKVNTDIGHTRFRKEAIIPILRDALTAYGLPVGQGNPQEVAATIASRPQVVRDELLAALEAWAALAEPIGISWKTEWGATVIAGVTPDSPAARDGRLKTGDQLVGVGQGRESQIVDTREMALPEAMKLLHGASGTIVRLTVIPRAETKPRTYDIQRDPNRAWLRAVLEATDPDPWRRRVRQALDRPDEKEQRAALETLADEPDVGRQPVRVLTNMADRLEGLGAGDVAIRLLRKVQQRHPSDPWTNSSLANLLRNSRPPQYDEAVRYSTAAIALRPDSSGLHVNLGVALHDQGKVEEAIAEYREALRIDPLYTSPRCNLVDCLIKLGKREEAEAVAREGIRLQPNEAAFHHNLGNALGQLDKWEEAISEYRESLRLDPKLASADTALAVDLFKHGKRDESLAKFREIVRMNPESAESHYNLGVTLGMLGRIDEALAEYRETLRLKPDHQQALVNLAGILTEQGKPEEVVAAYREALRHRPDAFEIRTNFATTLNEQGKVQESIDEFREAIRLYPRYPFAHKRLGNALQDQGKLDDAIACYQEAIRLEKDFAEAHHDLAFALRMKGALDKLPSILKGEARPANAADCLALALLCQQPYQRRYVASARFFADAFAAEPALAEKLAAQGGRYDAACAAALAGCGKGDDKPAPDEKERMHLRRQALDWLRAELKAQTAQTNSMTPALRNNAFTALRDWREDADLAGVRGEAALAKLPEAEREEWRTLWADVEKTLAKAPDAAPEGKVKDKP